MKQVLGVVLISFSLLFQSCVPRNIASVNQQINETENIQNESKGCFVEFADGRVAYFSSLKLIKGIATTPHLLGDGKVRIKAKHIKAYKNNEHYAISQKVYNPKRLSYVAVESLPGFAVQIAKGKLNIYVRKSYVSNKAIEEYFIQTNNDKITEYSYESMMDVIKNNPEAAEYFNSQKYKAARPILRTTAEMYNNSLSLSSSR